MCMSFKIPVPEKNVIPTTSGIGIDIIASSPSNTSPVTTSNAKLQVQKC